MKNRKKGFVIAATIAIGSILMLLALALFSFISNQHAGIHIIVNGEVAHFLAEAGVNRCVAEVRKSISKALTTDATNKALREILLKQGKVKDTNITNLLEGNWNKELERFAKEVDKTASIQVNVWLRDLVSTETKSNSWADPRAKTGYITIESTGKYKSGKRKLAIKRQVSVANILPASMSKFTMFMANSGYNSESKYNIIKNDYKGMITDGPKPLILYNHPTPDTPTKSSSYNFADSLKKEGDPDIWQQRGWVWIGGNKVRLNLSSGAGDLGEIFHFYDVTKPNDFSPIRFVTKEEALPKQFKSSNKIPWDKTATIVRSVLYDFNHSFILEGFHDKSNRKPESAMYEGDILSEEEKNKYGSYSSVLHLFGDARKGYQSATKVFGNVNAAFIRFSNLEITPKEPDVKKTFESFSPPPLYLLKSLTKGKYHNSIDIKDIANRQVGGPLLKTGMIFKGYSEYEQFMSRIVEQPYAYSYNAMQEVYAKAKARQFPPATNILQPESDSIIRLARDKHCFFEGIPSINNAVSVLNRRTHMKIETIAQFWDKFINSKGELELNAIIQIENEENQDFLFPPQHIPQPLRIVGGGAIILKRGNLGLRGALINNINEALTLVAEKASSVYFSNSLPNHLNVIAPEAELSYSQKFSLFGNLCVKSMYVDKRFQGGVVHYRTETDPTTSGYDSYYKVYVNAKDTYWND